MVVEDLNEQQADTLHLMGDVSYFRAGIPSADIACLLCSVRDQISMADDLVDSANVCTSSDRQSFDPKYPKDHLQLRVSKVRPIVRNDTVADSIKRRF